MVSEGVLRDRKFKGFLCHKDNNLWQEGDYEKSSGRLFLTISRGKFGIDITCLSYYWKQYCLSIAWFLKKKKHWTLDRFFQYQKWAVDYLFFLANPLYIAFYCNFFYFYFLSFHVISNLHVERVGNCRQDCISQRYQNLDSK